MVIVVSPALAQATMTSKTTFEPVHVGSNQRNLIMVVNKSDGFNSDDVHTNGDNKYLINHVIVKAFDPETGDLLDVREISEIKPGKGASTLITITIPQAHPSLVVVLVKFSHINGNAVNGGSEVLDTFNTNELPFIVTSLLVSRNHGTILQVKGVTELLNNGSTDGK